MDSRLYHHPEQDGVVPFLKQERVRHKWLLFFHWSEPVTVFIPVKVYSDNPPGRCCVHYWFYADFSEGTKQVHPSFDNETFAEFRLAKYKVLPGMIYKYCKFHSFEDVYDSLLEKTGWK